MASSPQSALRFRSATEFPKSIAQLDQDTASDTYAEMRDCLIFTNRSRAQLLRRNEEYKQSVLRLQTMIQSLGLEKQQLADKNRLIVEALEQEITMMATHLDHLADAFEGVADMESSSQTQWGFLALPQRFFQFLRAVRSIVFSWREQQPEGFNNQLPGGQLSLPGTQEQRLTQVESDEDRREHPQMYQDPASLGRSLLDD